MRTLEVLERSGMMGKTKLGISYIEDAMQEIQELMSSVVNEKHFYDITTGQRYYEYPTTMIEAVRMYAYDSTTTKYFPIPRAIDVPHPDTDENIDGSALTGDSWILILG